MPRPDAREHLQKSVNALKSGNLALAQSEAELAVDLDKSLASAFTAHAIALAKQGEPELATDSFRKAFMLEPTNPRHGYNLGAHLFAMREYWPARTAVSEALKDDPDFVPAKKLLDRIDTQDHSGEVEFMLPDLTKAFEAIEGDTPHTLVFMHGMEVEWTRLGWAFVGIAVLAAVAMFVFQPFPAPTALQVGKALPPLKAGAGPMVAIFLLALSGISSFMWVLIDLVDRKMKLVWIVPTIACCTCGLHAIPHAIYMLMRKT